MNKRLFGSIFGVGLLSLVTIGGVNVWARAQQAPPAGRAQGKAADNDKEGDDNEVVIKLAEAPEAVRAAAAKIVAPDKVTKVIKEEDEGITTYEIEYKADGLDASTAFSAAGEVLEIEKGIKDSALPAAALAALKKHYPAAAFGDHVAVQKFYYEVQVTVDGKSREVKVDAAGDIEDEHHGDAKGEKENGKKGDKDQEEEDDND